MPWLGWLSSSSHKSEDDKDREASKPLTKPTGSWERNLNSIDWSHYTSPQTITACIITSAATLALARLYKTYFRRIPSVDYLKPDAFRKRSIYGYVTSVGDGDNFHLFHTPGGRLAGWGWLPGKRIQQFANEKGKFSKDSTVHVRIAGVDAPELAHFGRPAQPYGQEALDWLRKYALHRYVRAYAYRRDQYDRVVCTAYVRRWLFFKSDIGHAMLKRGLASVYEAKNFSEFGGKEALYREAEAKAKRRKIGMWQEPGLIGRMLGREKSTETPREYKTRVAKEEKSAKTADATK